MEYKPKLLNIFSTFVILRRLDTISKFNEKNDITRVLAMFKEMFDNLSKSDIQTDIVSEHKEFLLGYMFIIIYDIERGLAPPDVLDNYICEIATYILNLRDGMEEVQNALRDSEVKLPGLLDKLPIELREIIAENSLW